MRLLHVLSQRPGRSGSGVFLAAMVREAAERGYQQHVIVAGPPGTSAAELPPLSEDEVTPIVFPSAEAPFPLPGNSDVMPYPTTVFARMTEAQIDQYLGASRRVMAEVRERFRPDVVHAHHLWLMTALAREMFDDVPLVATSHNAELRLAVKAPHLAERARPGLTRIDRVCVLTPQSVRDTIDGFGVAAERIALTGAGYDHTLFSPAGETPAAGTIAWVRRLSTSKGVSFLLEAVRRLPDPWRLLLVGATGTGEDGRHMDALVGAAGERVIHLGAVSREEVARILRGSSIFVLPSLFEGLPLTMLEALGCGCPAVVSALPTIASWIPPLWRERGWVELVPPLRTTRADEPVLDDVPRFVDELAAAMARQLARAGDVAWRRALAAELSPHSWAAVFERYERVYGEVATPRP